MSDDRNIRVNSQGEEIDIFLSPPLKGLVVLEYHKYGEHHVYNDGYFMGAMEQVPDAGSVIQVHTGSYLTASNLRDLADFLDKTPLIKPHEYYGRNDT